MPEKRLNIVDKDPLDQNFQRSFPSSNAINELEARFERLWLLHPEKFNPLKNSMQKERVARTQRLFQQMNLANHLVLDIGCGAGLFSRMLKDMGAEVIAADIATNALKKFKEYGAEEIQLKKEALPFTTFQDQFFDDVICLDVIGELPSKLHRLFFSELSRILKPDGFIVCSTPIDIGTDEGADQLLDLAETEFMIEDVVYSYHALFLKLKSFLEVPQKYVLGWEDPSIRDNELRGRKGFSKWWYSINTTFIFMWFWLACEIIARPFLSLLKNNRYVLLKLEQLCQFIWSDSGISHVIFLAKKRPLIIPEPEELPIERPRKKEVWE